MIFTGGPVGGGYGGGGSYAAGGMSAGGGSYAGGIPAGGGGVMGSGYGAGGGAYGAGGGAYGAGGGAYGAGGGAYGAGGIPGGGAYAGGGIPGSGVGMGTTRVVGGNGSCCGPSGTMHANAYGNARPGMTGTGTGTTVHANPGCGVGSAPSDTGCCVGGPETSCGGVGSACFEGAGNMVTSTDWTYVGDSYAAGGIRSHFGSRKIQLEQAAPGLGMFFTGGPVGGSYAAGGMNAGGGSYAGGRYVSGGIPAGGIPGGGAYVFGGIPSSAGFGTTQVVANPGCGIGSGPSNTGCCVGGPEANCAGLGDACFEGAGNMITSTDWAYVGEGRGAYEGTPNYSYVGQGAGSYAKETFVTPYGCRIRPCCLLLTLLSLLGLALAYFLAPKKLAYRLLLGGPETSCGGVGSACFEGAGNMVTSTDWTYVGEGRGTYAGTPNYSYVGQGAGSYEKETFVTPYGCRIRPCCLLLALLSLLGLALAYFLQKPAALVPAPVGPVGTCTLWGDPHIRTFDGIRSDYYSPGEFWIVKSDNVWIQGRYLPTKVTSGLGVTKSIAVGGPFLKGHKLRVEVRSASWDGQPVLTGFPSDFSVPGVIDMHYYSPGEFWIVKSDNVWIQGRYLPTKVTSGLGVTKSIAVGGPFLKGHKLRVEVRSASWDGQPVLTGFPSDFSVPGVIDMHYNNVGTLLQNGREGKALHIVHIRLEDGSPEGLRIQVNRWMEPAPGVIDMHYNNVGTLLQNGRGGKALHIVHIRLEDGSPEGLRIQVNRWMEPAEGDYMNVKITMHGQKGQDGHCGNFNANPQDDDRLQVRARVGKTGVDPKDSMYATKTPVMVANRPNINDCPAQQLEDAKTLCKQKEKKFIPSMACLIDVCFAGKGFAATG
eukprot:CAMPEP_0172927744 /NCGR_PEP_ID=MMETSP1075-20121228/217619_1 /TAXON_ID=2916 /ORGANISM="Ceratium fusus, Strain PA161109" /LENGTH=873 /DNA_ID=CAMNT_0013789013 /DNA_START=52 /DNA_END=2674 /DNA_ORIENTATION=-